MIGLCVYCAEDFGLFKRESNCLTKLPNKEYLLQTQIATKRDDGTGVRKKGSMAILGAELNIISNIRPPKIDHQPKWSKR
jgi:hypothetical protein